MDTSSVETARASGVEGSGTELTVHLKDGPTVTAPLTWFPRPLRATLEQRSNFELLGGGEGIHWPGTDEDLSVAGILRGVHASGA
jgi:hypothetical protein